MAYFYVKLSALSYTVSHSNKREFSDIKLENKYGTLTIWRIVINFSKVSHIILFYSNNVIQLQWYYLLYVAQYNCTEEIKNNWQSIMLRFHTRHTMFINH